MTDLFGSDNNAVNDLNVKYEGYATPSGICGENLLEGIDSCGKEAFGIKEHFGIKEEPRSSLCTNEEECKNIAVLSVTTNSGTSSVTDTVKGVLNGDTATTGTPEDNEND